MSVDVVGFDLISLLLGVLIFVFLWKVSQSSGKAGIINKLPGPMAFPVLGNLMELLEPRHEVLKNVMKRQQLFGTLFRVWAGPRPMVIFGNPDHIEILLRSTKHLEKHFMYQFLKPWLGTGLLTSHGPKWAMHRKLITPTFHFKILQGFVDVFHRNADVLANKVRAKTQAEQQIDIYSLVSLCTLDIICETAMGTKVNAQTENRNQYVRSVLRYAVARLSNIILHRMSRLWLYPDFVFKLSTAGREFQKHLDAVQGFTDQVIKSRRKALREAKLRSDAEQQEKYSFLDLLLEASFEEGSSFLTDEDIREEVETFMFEGHDTTASAISWALSLLGCHPKIQEECFQELKAIFADDPDRIPTLADLAEMKLLERVIKETLRLYPSVTAIGRTIEEDIRCDGYVIPRGTGAIISIYSMHRNPEYFPHPNKFDPDRFLPENSASRHPYSYIPFSAGPRNCIGQKFALYEEKVVLSTIIRNFRFESLQSPEESVRIPDLVLRPGCGIKINIWRR